MGGRLDSILGLSNDPVPQYNPSLSGEISNDVLGNFDKKLSLMGSGPDPRNASSIFAANPDFDTTDQGRIDKDAEVLQSWLGNAWNDFKRGIDNTQISTLKGKMYYTPYSSNHFGPESVVLAYPDQLAALEEQVKKGILSPDQFEIEKSSLDAQKAEAETKVAEYQQAIKENQLEIAAEPVSKEYMWRTAITQSQGDSAGLLDKLAYTAPGTLGSSSALLGGQLGVQLAANIGKRVTTALAKSLLAEAAGPEVGVPVQAVAAIGGLVAGVAETLYSRLNESYAEVGGTVDEIRSQLVEKYMVDNGLMSADQIDGETMRKIKLQSLKGADMQFKENMMLSTVDLAMATIMPLGTFSSTIANITKATRYAEEAIQGVQDYNKITRVLSTVARGAANAYGEKFEEGYQYAAGKRAEGMANNDLFYKNEGFLSNVFRDGYDTASSLDYSLLPGITARGDGRYSKDKEFQFSENSGGMLGMIMGALPAAVSIGKDLRAYSVAKRDLQNNGIKDIQGSLERLNKSILIKYFDNDQVHHIGEAIKSLVGKTDEQGNAFMTKEDSIKLVKDMKDTYEVYKTVGDKVDSIGRGKLNLGVTSVSMDDARTKQAKQMVKEDFLNSIMSMRTRRQELTQLEDEAKIQYAKDKELFEETSGVLDIRQNIELKKQALENIKNRVDTLVSANRSIIGRSSEAIKNRISELRDEYDAQLDQLDDLETDEIEGTYDERFDGISPALQENYEKQAANELFIRDYKDKVKELNKIKNKEELYRYALANAGRLSPDANLQDDTQEAAQPTPSPSASQTPGVTPLTDDEKLDADAFEADFINNQDKAEGLRKFYEDAGDDITQMPFVHVISHLRTFLRTNPQLLKDNFKAINEAYNKATGLDDMYKLNPDMSISRLSPAMNEISVDDMIPPTQRDDIDLNGPLIDNYKKEVEEPKGTSDKIVSGLSLAQLNVLAERRGYGDYTDSYDGGLLQFSEQHDQQLSNTNFVKTGDKLEIGVISIPEDFNYEDKSDANYDQISIGVYKEVEITPGVTKKMLIAHLHQVSRLDELLADTTDNKYKLDKEAEKELLRVNRRTIIEAGPNASFEAEVLSKGFGRINRNARGVLSTISNAIGSDTRPVISYVDANGEPASVFNETTVSIADMQKGATILLLPNETDNGEVFVPVYLVKRQLSADVDILDIVEKAVNDFLRSGNTASLKIARPYLYITNKEENKLNVGVKGIYASNRDGNIELFINSTPFTPANREGLREALGETYFAVNKNFIKEQWYQDTLMKSPLLQTNITANPILLDRSKDTYRFLGEQKYSYFSQHTLTIGSILQEEKEESTTTEEVADTDDFMSQFDTFSFDEIDVEQPKMGKLAKIAQKTLGSVIKFWDDISSSNKRLVVSADIPVSLQHEMVRSIAYNLVNAEKPEDNDVDRVKNVERARAWVKGRYNNFSDGVKAQEAKDPNHPNLKAARIVTENHRLMDENFDALLEKAKELIDGLGYKYDENTDYYENMEEADDNDFNSFDDDANSTRDQKEFLPKEVKKLMYFIPALRPLTQEEKNMMAKQNDALASQGKVIKPIPEYIEVKNQLLLPTFNNFNDTWEKTLEITTSKFFDATNSGFEKMLTTLQDKRNPPVVQELAKNLQAAPEQVQNAFFRRTRLQKQTNKSSLYTAKSKVRKGGVAIKKFMGIFDSDRKQGIKATFNEMQQEFLIANTGMLVPKDDAATGSRILTVDQEFAKSLQRRMENILDNKEGSFEDGGRNKAKEGAVLKPTAKNEIYQIIRQIGINISPEAFDDFLRTYRTLAAGSSKHDSIIREVFLRNILGRLAGNITRSSKQETEEGDEGGFDDLRANDPFRHERKTLEAIARREFKYRQLTQSGSYYFEGKSYYAFTRPNYISDFFTKIKEYQTTGIDTFIRSKIAGDVFARRSVYLNGLLNPRVDMELGLFYELGSRNDSSNSTSKLLKDMNPREHEVTKLAWFQNRGDSYAYYMYDTLSDKTTKPVISAHKFDISDTEYVPSLTGEGGTIKFSDVNLERYYNSYFLNEFERIMSVYDQNANLPSHQKIKGYHGDKGMGKYFLTFYFLNKDILAAGDASQRRLAEAMYTQDGILKPITGENQASLKQAIKDEINKHMNRVIEKNKQSFREMGMFDLDAMVTDEKTGRKKNQPNLTDIIDHNYFFSGDNSVEKKLQLENTTGMKDAMYYGDWSGVPRQTLERIVDYVVADYVYNYVIFSNEMLILTGDPAQAGKMASKDTLGSIKKVHKDNLLEMNRQTLLANIEATYVNLGKRNAAFLASGEGGKFKDTHYNVAIAEDMNTSSEHIKYYTDMFGDAAEGAYGETDKKTDAQEVTTVKEFLTNMQAYGMIDEDKYIKALYMFDREQYNEDLRAGLIKAAKPNSQERFDLFKLVMQPQKPVQRTYNIDTELGISKQYYIKTSAYPLIPSLLTGAMRELLDDMKANDVQRVAFVSGVKQGVAGAKHILDDKGQYNKGFFENNKNTLHRNGFRIQLEVPFKESKDHIREGTQQSKLLFVDIPDNTSLTYRGERTNASNLKEKYIDYHRQIIEYQRAELFKEIGVTEAGPSMNIDLKKLSQMLQREGEGRGYALNSLLGLDLTSDGKFKIPLTFLPNAGQIEPVVTALLSNNITRLKMPGKSYVQGSEFMLQTGIKGRVETDEALKDRRDIIWTDPKYTGLEKLSYLHKDDEGNIRPAQIIMPFYFVKEGKMLDVNDFLIEQNGRKYLDTSKIDPELLQMNGFRIPFQGLNSGMWFEIVGFLPYTAGDLVIVPAEIAGQMGSDYDVDKLYSYMYNYTFGSKDAAIERAVEEELMSNGALMDENGNYSDEDTRAALEKVLANPPASTYEIIKIDNPVPTTKEELQNALIDIQKSIYTSDNEDIHKAILEPLSFDDMEETIVSLNLKSTSEFLGNFDPVYQREVYFSNVTGKLGTAISANGNTSHAMAQGANLFIKGEGFVFLDEQGNPYSDHMLKEEEDADPAFAEKKVLFDKAIRAYLADFGGYSMEYYKKELEVAHKIIKAINWTEETKASASYNELQSLLADADKAMQGENLTEAHNSIAGVMYHLVNMAKNNNAEDKVMIEKRIRLINDNAVNETYDDTYQYYDDNEDDYVDNNSKENNTAWRLDKIFTFDINPRTGRPYIISNLISQVLGISVDNAKEQKLGALGINRLNFNVALGIMRVGFGPHFMAAFINQPILKEYYERIGETEDIYKVDYTANKRDKVINDLFAKYAKMYNISEDIQGSPSLQGHKLSELTSWLRQGITSKNAKDQLYILKAFLKYKEVADGLQGITSAFNVDAKGLPKNMSETAAKQEQIANMAGDNPTMAGNPIPLGNVGRYRSTTIPGLFLGVPTDAVRIFMGGTDPIFAYASASYKRAAEMIMRKIGRSALNQEQMDKMHNNIKEFVYSGFQFPDGRDITEERERLLLDSPANESLQTRFISLRNKYPKNELFNVLKEVGSIYPDNPKLLDLPMSAEEDFVQKVSEYWENAIYNNPDPDVQNFAKDLIKYALWINPKEYGITNIIRYAPFRYREEIGFHEYLRTINGRMSQVETLTLFPDQFLEHNEEMMTNAKEEHFMSGSLMKGDNNTINSFTLPPIVEAERAENPASNLIRVDKKGVLFYPEYLVSFNNKDIGKQLYRGEMNPDGSMTYWRKEKKGMQGMSEYTMNKSGERTIVATQRIALTEPGGDTTIINEMMGGPAPFMIDGPNEVRPEGEYLTPERNADEILMGIIHTDNDIIVNPSASKLNKQYARYYQEMAKWMQFKGLDNVNIILDESHPNAATASITSDGTASIKFNPVRISGVTRTGLSQELEKQRIILHEMLHIMMFRALNDRGNSEEYKKLESVWRSFRENIQTSKTGNIRGIPVSVFDAELFTLIKTMYDKSRADEMNNRDFLTYASSLINNPATLKQVMDTLGARLADLHQHGRLGKSNFDLLSNSDRANDFRDYVVNEFMPNLKANTNKYYSYYNIDEFVSEVMTNRETQELLRGMPSIWARLVSAIKDFVASILGIEQDERTLFDDSLDAITGFLKLGEKGVSSQDTQFTPGVQDEVDITSLDDYIDELIKQGFIQKACK